MNTFAKLMESVVAARIAYAVEEHRILPDTHLGGRKGISIDHVFQLLLDRVRTAWGLDHKVSMVLLDVAGAYDNVSHRRLLANMKKLGLGALVPWVLAFLSNRSTRIKLPGYLSEAFPTPTGIPQGSTLSPILFLLFNTPLVQTCTKIRGNGRTEAFGWVDDVAIIAISHNYYTNVQLLQRALREAETWAKRHAARFAPDKFELIHFKNPKESPTIPPGNSNVPQANSPTSQEIFSVPPTNSNVPPPNSNVPLANSNIPPASIADWLVEVDSKMVDPYDFDACHPQGND